MSGFFIAKCIKTNDYNKQFLTMGESYVVKTISNLAVQVRGDDGEFHLTHQIYFKGESLNE